jgi:predicted nicotinamide N-methyase
MTSSERAFVLRHTRLQQVPGLEDIQLHLSDNVLGLWRAVQETTADPDAAIPFWAFAWGGGLAISHYVCDHPDAVAGKRVLDLGSGSGLCATGAMKAGAAAVTAVDIDPFACAATAVNARANGVRIEVVYDDILDDEPPRDVDVILAGDCWYDERFAARATSWLERAAHQEIDVLIGDPHRRYAPLDKLNQIATYDVRTTTDLEDLARTTASVYRLSV